MSLIVGTREVGVSCGAAMLDYPAVVDVSRLDFTIFSSGEISQADTFVVLTDEAQPNIFGFSPRDSFIARGIGAKFSNYSWLFSDNFSVGIGVDWEVERPVGSKIPDNKYIPFASSFFLGIEDSDIFAPVIDFAIGLPRAGCGFTNPTVFGLPTGRAVAYYLLFLIGEIFCPIFLSYRHILAMFRSLFLALVSCSNFFYRFWRMDSPTAGFGHSLSLFFGENQSCAALTTISGISKFRSKTAESRNPSFFFCGPLGNWNPIQRFQFRAQSKPEQEFYPSIFVSFFCEAMRSEMHSEPLLRIISLSDIANRIVSWIDERIDVCVWSIIKLRLGYLLQQGAHILTSERGGAAHSYYSALEVTCGLL